MLLAINKLTYIWSSLRIVMRAWHLFIVSYDWVDTTSKVWTKKDAQVFDIKHISLVLSFMCFPCVITHSAPRLQNYSSINVLILSDKWMPLLFWILHLGWVLKMKKMVSSFRWVIDRFTSSIGHTTLEVAVGGVYIELELYGLICLLDQFIHVRPPSRP